MTITSMSDAFFNKLSGDCKEIDDVDTLFHVCLFVQLNRWADKDLIASFECPQLNLDSNLNISFHLIFFFALENYRKRVQKQFDSQYLFETDFECD